MTTTTHALTQPRTHNGERQPRLVAIDDEPSVLRLVERFARGEGFDVQTHADGRHALSRLCVEPADVALVDLRMPNVGGLDVLRAIREAHPDCQVILMTAHASVETAIEAVKAGALDYISKPLDLPRLRQLLAGVLEEDARRAALLFSETETARRMELCGMIGRSAIMQELFALVRRVAPHARVALVTGETGTGKEGIARAIHDLGPRRGRPFITVNCSAVVETLFESELFGHVRGAFTGATENKAGLFAAADGGSLFLDEVGELPLGVQAKLLRVLETGEVHAVGALQPRKVDVRIVAATNRDLAAECEKGRFRSDLYYRLNVVELSLPPLRMRREDIPYLTAAFIREFASRFGRPIEGVTPAAERSLMLAAWTGNVRQLRNVLERACMLADSRFLTERNLGSASLAPADSAPSRGRLQASRTAVPALTGPVDLRSIEHEHIVRMLTQVRGNKRAAAQLLGVSRRTLYRRLAQFEPRVRESEGR